MSEEEIVQAYNMGLMAIQKISNFIEKYGNHCEFAFRPTFLFSNSIFSIGKLNKEYLFRKSHGFECELFDDQNNPFLENNSPMHTMEKGDKVFILSLNIF